MSLLTIVQSHCKRYGLNNPSTVIGNADTTVQQLLEILQEIPTILTDQANFQLAQREATHTLTAAANQGDIFTITGDAGFLYIKSGTFFDRTQGKPICGPMTDQEWQAAQAITVSGTNYSYRFRGDDLLISPTPTAGNLSDLAFEYVSSYLLESSGGTPKASFTLDTDTVTGPIERILKKGLAWRWKRDKGLEYQGDEDEFWTMVNNLSARDGGKRPINIADSGSMTLKAGVIIPIGDTVP